MTEMDTNRSAIPSSCRHSRCFVRPLHNDTLLIYYDRAHNSAMTELGPNPTCEWASSATMFYHPKSKFHEPLNYKKNELKLYALSNEIDRLFQQSSFFLEGTKLSGSKYGLLEPSLRLATHMIYSPLLHNFWSTIFLTQPTYWQDKKDALKYGLEFAYDTFDPDREPSDTEIEDTITMIDRLHRHVLFVISDRAADHCMTAQYGEAHVGPKDMSFEQAEIPRGYRSEIYIPPSWVDELEAADADPLDVPRRLALRFNMALNLVHELAHAAWNMVNGRLDFEPFFGNEIISELGFELERQLFDGRLDLLWKNIPGAKSYHSHGGRQSKINGMYVLWDYPNQNIVESYRGMPCLQVRQEPKDERSCDLAWRVDLKHLEKFFNNDFWSSDECKSRMAWVPPRRVGKYSMDSVTTPTGHRR